MEIVNESRVELIKHNASDLDVARAAWVSTLGEDAREKDGDRVKGLINYLYSNKHMSPFEHGSFTFFIETPIFVAREFMRHRTASYNEVSGRYTEMKPKFYIAPKDRPMVQEGKVGNYFFTEGSPLQNEVKYGCTFNAYEYAWTQYQNMLKVGIAREVARDVLPVGIMTQFYVTMNPRNVMQFLTLRTADNALYEIREVADKMEALFAEAMPLTYDAYVWDSYKSNIDAAATAEAAPESAEYWKAKYLRAVTARGVASDVVTANQVLKDDALTSAIDQMDVIMKRGSESAGGFAQGGYVNGEKTRGTEVPKDEIVINIYNPEAREIAESILKRLNTQFRRKA